MLLSLTEILRVAASAVIGLEFTRNGFTVALHAQGPEQAPVCSVTLPALFGESGMTMSSEAVMQLSASLQTFPPNLPLHVALPNPVARLLTIRSQERTRGRKDTEQLVRWHAQRLGSPLNGMRVDFQWTGRQKGEHYLFAIAAPEAILEPVFTAARGRVVRMAAPAIIYLHRLTGGHRPSLVIDIQEDSWALLVTDRSGNVRLARSDWRQPDDDPELLVDEARRFVNAAGEHCEPHAVRCWCEPGQWETLEHALQARFPASAGNVQNVAARFWSHGKAAKAIMAAFA